jgi:hypothetical protein
MAGGQDQTIVSNYLNSTLPTAVGGKPTAWVALATTTAMLMRLDSTLATASAAGTQLTGTGYTAGGTALGQSTASTAGAAVTLPAATTSWTNGSGSGWSIASLDITDSAATRSWWGPWNGQPIAVANGNTFQVAANAVSVSDT